MRLCRLVRQQGQRRHAREAMCHCLGGQMFRSSLAAGSGAVSVSGSNLTWVVVVGVVALLALAVAAVLVREVLAAIQGTERMQEIAKSIQEGAAAYLRRQFRTVGVFVVIIFFVLSWIDRKSTRLNSSHLV